MSRFASVYDVILVNPEMNNNPKINIRPYFSGISPKRSKRKGFYFVLLEKN